MEIISHASNVKRGNGIITKEKLVEALKSPATKIEIDVNITKDNEFICYHNPTFKPLKKVSRTMLKEVLSTNPNILTLEEVLAIINGKKDLMLDIKNYGIDNLRILYELLERLKEYQCHTLMIESFDSFFLEKIKEQLPSIETCLLINNFTKIANLLAQKTDDIDAFALASELFLKNKKYQLIKDALNEAQKMYAWTWNLIYRETPELFQKYIDCTCDGIITDEVYVLAKEMKQIK